MYLARADSAGKAGGSAQAALLGAAVPFKMDVLLACPSCRVGVPAVLPGRPGFGHNMPLQALRAVPGRQPASQSGARGGNASGRLRRREAARTRAKTPMTVARNARHLRAGESGGERGRAGGSVGGQAGRQVLQGAQFWRDCDARWP